MLGYSSHAGDQFGLRRVEQTVISPLPYEFADPREAQIDGRGTQTLLKSSASPWRRLLRVRSHGICRRPQKWRGLVFGARLLRGDRRSKNITDVDCYVAALVIDYSACKI